MHWLTFRKKELYLDSGGRYLGFDTRRGVLEGAEGRRRSLDLSNSQEWLNRSLDINT